MENKANSGINDYLIPKIDDYFFDELSDDYLRKAGIRDFMKGVSIPIKRSDLGSLSSSTLSIAKNMAFVIGCDPEFRFREAYLEYIRHFFSKDLAKPLINEGAELADAGKYEEAVILFRAARLIDPENHDALFCYARACKDCYDNGEGETYIGLFKAESLRAFERLTIEAPEYDMGYYFLGFAYLNLGMYRKADLTFRDFEKYSSKGEYLSEVAGLREKLKEPIRIEDGYTMILRGQYDAGIGILEDYTGDERFNHWWPLWYYLGTAYEETGRAGDAENAFLMVLALSPSNTDAMEELASIYELGGRAELASKYRNKIKIVKKNMELDRMEKEAGEQSGRS